MSKNTSKPLTDSEGEVRELEAEDIRAMRPAAEVLPAELVAILPKRRPGQRGPGKQPAKQLVTLRIPPDVIEAYRETGKGWQTRMVQTLSRDVKKSAGSALGPGSKKAAGSGPGRDGDDVFGSSGQRTKTRPDKRA